MISFSRYASKDEINLMIRIRGFEKLYDLLTKRSAAYKNMEDKFKAMIHAYLEFGLTSPGYYDIMFNLHTPKYLDYVGTETEPLAYTEKQNALKCLSLFIEPLRSYLLSGTNKNDAFVLYQVVKFWSDLHGLVTLTNSRLFHEVLEDVDSFVRERSSDLIENVTNIGKNFDNGQRFSKNNSD